MVFGWFGWIHILELTYYYYQVMQTTSVWQLSDSCMHFLVKSSCGSINMLSDL